MSTEQKGINYDLIFVVIDWLIQMIYYEPVQITIDIPVLMAGYIFSNCLL